MTDEEIQALTDLIGSIAQRLDALQAAQHEILAALKPAAADQRVEAQAFEPPRLKFDKKALGWR